MESQNSELKWNLILLKPIGTSGSPLLMKIIPMNHKPAMRQVVVIAVTLVATLAMLAEDVTFLNNRRQWEKLPTATVLHMGFKFAEEREMPDSAVLCYTILANRLNNRKLQGKELEQCIGAVCNLGTVYLNSYNDLSRAFSYLLQAEELAIKHNEKKLLAHVYTNQANLYQFESELNPSKPHEDQILAIYKKAFYIGIGQEEWGPIVPSFITMVEMAFVKQQLDSVANEIRVFSRLNIPDTVYGAQFAQKLCEGIQLWQNHLNDKALLALKELGNSENWTDNSGFANSALVIKHIILYVAYHQLGQEELALEHIKESEKLAREYQLKEGLMVAYQNYSQYYTDLGDKVHADFYRLKRYELQDSISKASHVNDINTVRFLREIDKMNEEQRALTVKQQHDRQLLWIVSAAALVAIVMLVLLYQSRRRIQEGYRRIYQQNVELLAADEARRQAEAELPAKVAAETPKYSHNQMDNDVMDELWQQIVNIMQTSEEIYRDTFDVEQLCEMLGAKRAYVSQTINTKTGDSFTALLNEYRIREACRRMNDTSNYGKYTLEGIARSIGYSRSYFVRIFKEATGIPPSAYMKLARNNEAPDTPFSPQTENEV